MGRIGGTKKSKSHGKKEKELGRDPLSEWVGAPDGVKSKIWNLFIACGEAVLRPSVGPRRIPRPNEEDLLLAAMDEDVRRLLPDTAPEPPAQTPPGDAGEDKGPTERIRSALLERQGRRERTTDLSKIAFQLLTSDPMSTFPFLRTGPLGVPAPAVVCVAVICAQYVLGGEAGPLGDLRELFRLFSLMPDDWELLGKSLAAYCHRRGALLGFAMDDDAISALDGRVFLKRPALQRLIGLSPNTTRRLAAGRADRARTAGEGNRKPAQSGSEPSVITLSSPTTGLDGLILPQALLDDLRLVEALCRRRPASAPTLLFHGHPGTGKTHAAGALAGSLRRKLATASLAQLKDKYVGETEKHIEAAFREASESGAVLLLDEADALLHSREYAQRTFEISWVNTLLKCLEAPKGPVILCTNFVEKLDPAVHRRITHMLEFPLPEEAERAAIWALELAKARIRFDGDLHAAVAVPLSGGLIANAVRQVKTRRTLLGQRYKITSAALVEAAFKEAPKLGSAMGLMRVVGFGA